MRHLTSVPSRMLPDETLVYDPGQLRPKRLAGRGAVRPCLCFVPMSSEVSFDERRKALAAAASRNRFCLGCTTLGRQRTQGLSRYLCSVAPDRDPDELSAADENSIPLPFELEERLPCGWKLRPRVHQDRADLKSFQHDFARGDTPAEVGNQQFPRFVSGRCEFLPPLKIRLGPGDRGRHRYPASIHPFAEQSRIAEGVDCLPQLHRLFVRRHNGPPDLPASPGQLGQEAWA